MQLTCTLILHILGFTTGMNDMKFFELVLAFFLGNILNKHSKDIGKYPKSTHICKHYKTYIQHCMTTYHPEIPQNFQLH